MKFELIHTFAFMGRTGGMWPGAASFALTIPSSRRPRLKSAEGGGVTPEMVCDTHVWSNTCSLSCLLSAFCLVLSSVFTWEFSCYLRVKEKAWNWKKERLIPGKCRNRLKTLVLEEIRSYTSLTSVELVLSVLHCPGAVPAVRHSNLGMRECGKTHLASGCWVVFSLTGAPDTAFPVPNTTFWTCLSFFLSKVLSMLWFL